MQEDRLETLLTILTEAIDEIVRIKREIREASRRDTRRPRFSVNPDIPIRRREREGGG